MPNLIAASAFFLAIHLLVSGTPLRAALVARLGERAYRALFSLASALGLAWMIYAYAHAGTLELWRPLPGLEPPAFALVFVAFLFVVIGLATPNPTSVGMESRLAAATDSVHGMTRITRHPFLWGVALWALVHLLMNGDLASLMFFGTLLLLALGGTRSIDAKRRRSYGDGWARFARATSNLPFAAILGGRNSLGAALREIGVVRPLVAVLAYLLVFHFHGRLFGAPLA